MTDRSLPARLLLSLVLVLPGSLCRAQELVWEESEAAVEIDGRSRLVLSDLHGTISLRVAHPGAMRYAARTLDNRREKVPVTLLQDAGSFILRATEELAGQALLLEVGVPPELTVVLRVDDSILSIGGLHNDIQIIGKKLDVTLRSARGEVRLALNDSKLDLDGANESLTLEGSGIQGSVKRVEGMLTLQLAQSQLHLFQVAGMEGEIEASSVNIESALKFVDLKAGQSQLVAGALQAGGQFYLKDTPLTLRKSNGHFEIDSDAQFDFEECSGVINLISGYGGSVRGSSSKALVSIETNGAAVTLNQMEGAIQIQGDDLQIRTDTTKDKLTVVSTASNLQIESAEGPVNLHNDFGEIRVRNTSKPVEIVSNGGSVLLTEISGPLDVWADGEEVQVSWTVLTAESRGFIQNESGSVSVTLPRTAQCRVEAETDYGEIESQVAALEVSDDGKSVSGNLGRAAQPLIKIKSAGDLRLGLSGTAQAAE